MSSINSLDGLEYDNTDIKRININLLKAVAMLSEHEQRLADMEQTLKGILDRIGASNIAYK